LTSRIPSTTSAVMEPKNPSLNLEDEVRRRAYDLYEQRGGEQGHDVEDWLRAEEEVGRGRLSIRFRRRPYLIHELFDIAQPAR
jgi:hypothetical protein